MIYLDDKTLKIIEETTEGIIRKKLLEGFQNRKFQPVVTVEEIKFWYTIDEEQSNRNTLVIGPVKLNARVFVNLKDELGQTSDLLQLRINSIKFEYDEKSDKFIISDENKIEIINMS